MDKEYDLLFKETLTAYNNAYAPYSKFKVGAALITTDGKVFKGANIENASYSLTICAERSVLTSAYSSGIRKADIQMLGIVANTKQPIAPCGACRQVINELMDADASIVLFNINKEYKVLKVKDLLPYPFTEGDLH